MNIIMNIINPFNYYYTRVDSSSSGSEYNNNNDIALEKRGFENIKNNVQREWYHRVINVVSIMFIIAVLIVMMGAPWLMAPCSHDMRTAHHHMNGEAINTIAFGSCANGMHSIPIFDDIQADVMVFLGDNIYADTQILYYMHWMYNRLSCKPEFKSLMKRIRYVLAIWDDHDYGQDNGGADYPAKYESQSIFLDFFRIPSHSERRREGGGVYGSYKFKVRGSADQTITIILPDLRFFREPLKFCENGEYYPREYCFCPANRSMLGKTQWIWLDDIVNKSQSEDALTIIGSSTQFGHSANGYESWTNFPLDRARLKNLLDPSKSLIISGDVHWGEISVFDGLIDATSSGFTEIDPNIMSNTNRIGNTMTQQNYGLINLKDKTVSIYGLGGKLLSIKWGEHYHHIN